MEPGDQSDIERKAAIYRAKIEKYEYKLRALEGGADADRLYMVATTAPMNFFIQRGLSNAFIGAESPTLNEFLYAAVNGEGKYAGTFAGKHTVVYTISYQKIRRLTKFKKFGNNDGVDIFGRVDSYFTYTSGTHLTLKYLREAIETRNSSMNHPEGTTWYFIEPLAEGVDSRLGSRIPVIAMTPETERKQVRMSELEGNIRKLVTVATNPLTALNVAQKAMTGDWLPDNSRRGDLYSKRDYKILKDAQARRASDQPNQ